MPVMTSVDALPNGTAIGTRVSAFVWASILAMLTDIAPFFDCRPCWHCVQDRPDLCAPQINHA
jgi:hypothetical protein